MTKATWTLYSPPALCTTLGAGCPSVKTGSCTDYFSQCTYPDGSACSCAAAGSACQPLSQPTFQAPCPALFPNSGSACDEAPAGTFCQWQACGPATTGLNGAFCNNGAWIWQDCVPHVCASPDTPIATPDGERHIADIQVGDLVYSVDGQGVRVVPVARVRRQPAEHHSVVRVTTVEGRILEISAPHPTADGRSFGDLHAGGLLDGHQLRTVEVIPYQHGYTYDILPASDTGAYFAAGMLIGSTLDPRFGRPGLWAAASDRSLPVTNPGSAHAAMSSR